MGPGGPIAARSAKRYTTHILMSILKPFVSPICISGSANWTILTTTLTHPMKKILEAILLVWLDEAE